MAKTSTRTNKTTTLAKQVAAELPVSLAASSATLKTFCQRDPEDAGVSFTRYWYEGLGLRSGVASWVMAKVAPGDDPRFGKAAKVEVQLPRSAPGDYADLAFLLRQVEETLPPYERHVMIQLKLALDPEEPWHVGYERVRAFARHHFVSQRFAVILVAHVPSVAGLDGHGSHVHCIVLSRRLGINGLEGACYKLCSDRGCAEAFAAWRTWRGAEENAA